eukprot:8910912-Pyramimonas_sp.AAC.2
MDIRNEKFTLLLLPDEYWRLVSLRGTPRTEERPGSDPGDPGDSLDLIFRSDDMRNESRRSRCGGVELKEEDHMVRCQNNKADVHIVTMAGPNNKLGGGSPCHASRSYYCVTSI